MTERKHLKYYIPVSKDGVGGPFNNSVSPEAADQAIFAAKRTFHSEWSTARHFKVVVSNKAREKNAGLMKESWGEPEETHRTMVEVRVYKGWPPENN